MASVRHIPGLTNAPNFRWILQRIYKRTQRLLQTMPKDSAYRINTEQIICHRLSVVNEMTEREDIENAICCGRIESLISQAQAEYNLCQTMIVYKPWEPSTTPPPPDQWKWPHLSE